MKYLKSDPLQELHLNSSRQVKHFISHNTQVPSDEFKKYPIPVLHVEHVVKLAQTEHPTPQDSQP